MKERIRSPRCVIELARKMRLKPSPAETILGDYLKEKKLDGYRFRQQHSIYRFIMDFYCDRKRLAIELDGDVHRLKRDYNGDRDELLLDLLQIYFFWV